MLLVLDVGNTQTVIGLYESPSSESLITTWRLATNKTAAVDDIRSKVMPLFALAKIDTSQVMEAILASVVPSLSTAWTEAIRSIWGIDAVVCNADAASKVGLFKTDYPNPSEIGQDRIADAVAARCIFGAPSMIVDFGTATNIEAVGVDGSFLGGVIAPGLRTGADALFSHATKLAATDLIAPKKVIGRSTEEAIQSGVVLGEAYRADALLRAMLDEMGVASKADGGTCSVIATGGFAELVSQCSNVITDVDPNLTLKGLRLVMEKMKEEGLC